MRHAFVVGLVLLLPIGVSAQTREPLPRFAIDLHAALVGLPTTEGWIPEVSADTEVPGRAWGLAAAITAYPFRAGIMTLGIGVGFSQGTGTSQSRSIRSGTGATATTRVTPAVRTEITNLAPQVSVNFGHKLGWSYLSAGIGRSKAFSAIDNATTASTVDVGWNQALNFGGGARWFMRPRLGAGFDVRFVKLGSRAATDALPFALRTQTITVSAGISIQ